MTDKADRSGMPGSRRRDFIKLMSASACLAGVQASSAAAAAAAAAASPRPGGEADLILRNGFVVTLDDRSRVTTALAVRGNLIVAVGSDEEAMAWKGAGTKVIDLHGRGVVPGFIDSHTHVESTSQFEHFWVDLHSPPLPAERTSRHIVAKLRERVRIVKPGDWVIGQGPFGNQIPPTSRELSEAFPQNPVVVKYGMHQYVANRKAIELAGVTKLTADPPGAKIERGPDGEPTGMFYECFEIFPITYDREALKTALSKTLYEDFVKQGVTSVYELSVNKMTNGIYQDLYHEGRLPTRLHIGYMIEPALQPTIDFPSIMNMSIHTGFGDDWLKIGPAKLFVNGALDGVSLIRRDQAALNNAVLQLHHAGWQLWLHAIGDNAQDMALEALEKALAAYPKPDARHRIEHIGSALDVPRFKRMRAAGIIPVPTEIAQPYRRSPAEEAKTRISYPYRTLLDMGLRPPGNSDTGGSYSGQMNVMHRLGMFVHREMADGSIYHPEEAVSVMDALRILSTYGAYAGFEETNRGTLAAGLLADMAILSANPLSTSPARLKDMKVDVTIIDGTIRYERG